MIGYTGGFLNGYEKLGFSDKFWIVVEKFDAFDSWMSLPYRRGIGGKSLSNLVTFVSFSKSLIFLILNFFPVV
jgi:hypothetical protein